MEIPKSLGPGVHFRVASKWVTAPAEVADRDGRIHGDVSRPALSAKARVETLVRVPEGAEVAGYQLVRLRKHGYQRDFRPVSDVVPVGPVEVAPGVWKIVLDSLPSGEYGFLAPAYGTGPDRTGNIYTFRIGERESSGNGRAGKLSWMKATRDPAFRF